MAVKNFISGLHVTLSFRQNNVPIILNAKSISVEEVGSESVDEVNGEDRGRPQWIVDYYRVRLGLYIPDMELLDAHLADTLNDDAAVAPLTKSIGIGFRLLNGTRKAYNASEGTRGAWKLDSSDRMGRVMTDIEYRFRRFKAVTI